MLDKFMKEIKNKYNSSALYLAFYLIGPAVFIAFFISLLLMGVFPAEVDNSLDLTVALILPVWALLYWYIMIKK